MKYKVLIYIIILGLFYSCTTPKYYVLKNSQFANLDFDKILINYIPVADELVTESIILDSTYNLLTKKKYFALENFVKSINETETNSADLNLALTFSSISYLDYSNALISLNKINNPKYNPMKDLLNIDISYEIDRHNENFDYKKYLQKYQKLIDTYPEDIILKKIVAIRLRYLRYNY
jgi:hypothetical protein